MMKKILVIGSAGAGKSTLTKSLGALLNIPVVHLDTYFWLPGWQERDKNEFLQKLRQTLLEHTWIIDGNYSQTLSMRIENADTIIFLDRSRWTCLYRVIKRWLTYRNRNREDMASGCPERINLAFLKWVWNYPNRSRNGVLEILKKQRGKSVIILKNDKEVFKLLEEIKLQTSPKDGKYTFP